MSKVKQERYTSAFSTTFNVYVIISHAHQDVDGNWIYTCSSNYSTDFSRRFTNNLHRECELTRFII